MFENHCSSDKNGENLVLFTISYLTNRRKFAYVCKKKTQIMIHISKYTIIIICPKFQSNILTSHRNMKPQRFCKTKVCHSTKNVNCTHFVKYAYVTNFVCPSMFYQTSLFFGLKMMMSLKIDHLVFHVQF